MKEHGRKILGYNNWWQIAQNSSYFTKITNASAFTHLWSLSLEMQIYIIWPLLFIIYKNIENKYSKKVSSRIFLYGAIISFVIMALSYQPGNDPSRIYYGTDTRIFSILLGAYLGAKQCNKERIRNVYDNRKLIKNIFYISMIILIYLYIFMNGQSTFTYRGGMFIVSILFVIMIEIITISELQIGKYLDVKPLSWIGKRSYEIYLWQYPVIFIYSKLVVNSSKPVHVIIQVIIILAISGYGIVKSPSHRMTDDQIQLQNCNKIVMNMC